MHIFLQGLKDDHNSLRAAKGICVFSPSDVYADTLISEIERFSTRPPKTYPEFEIEQLLLSLGKMDSKAAVKEIEPVIHLFNKAETNHVLLIVKIKLGFALETASFKRTLQIGKAQEKVNALKDIEYINRPEFISSVAPLLWDYSDVGAVLSNGHYKRYVAGYAVTALHAIDPDFLAVEGVPSDEDYYVNPVIFSVQEQYIQYKPEWVK